MTRGLVTYGKQMALRGVPPPIITTVTWITKMTRQLSYGYNGTLWIIVFKVSQPAGVARELT